MRPSGAFRCRTVKIGRVLRRRHRRVPDDGPVGVPPPSIGSAVARFMLGSLVAIAVVVVGGFFALRSITIDEAERDTRERVQIEGRLVEDAR